MTSTTDPQALRDRIAEALIAWTYRGKDPEHGGILETVRANAYSRADAVLAVLQTATLRELELLYRPNTTPSRPKPRRVGAEQHASTETGDGLKRAHVALAEQAGRDQRALDRIRQMVDAWEQRLPEVIRTPAVVSAIRAALELAEGPRRVAAEEQPAETQDAGPACTPDREALRDRIAAAVDEGFRLYAELEDLSLGASITDSVMAALDAERPVVGEQPDTRTPRRGDLVEAWLKAQRDRDSRDIVRWEVLDDALDLYRLHADTGTPLGEHVCAGDGCDCLEQPDTQAREAVSPDVDPMYDPRAWETYRRDAGCGCTAPAPVDCKIPHGTGAWLCPCHRLSGPPWKDGDPRGTFLSDEDEELRKHFQEPNRCTSTDGIFRCSRPTGHPGQHRTGRTFWGRRAEDAS